ncbi:hypothetical protein ACWD7M_16300 [Streptomyces griseus]
MTRTPKISPAGQRALTAMRARHGGALGSGEGFAITTMRPLERAGLVTLSTWRAADRTLSAATRHVEFTATLTDAGWGEHPRPAAPERTAPTPESELRPGDTVVNVHSGTRATWVGPSTVAPDTYVTRTAGAAMNTPPGCWAFVSRPEPAPEHPEPAPAADGPQTSARSPRGLLYAVGHRVAFRTRDGFTHSGPVREITVGADGRTMVTFDADRRATTPPRRTLPGIPRTPARITPIDPPKPWTASIDDPALTPDRT